MNDDIDHRIKQNNIDRRSLMLESLTQTGRIDRTEAERLIDKGIPQSQLFMSELVPIIHRLYSHQIKRQTKSVLDIGPHTFGGTQLLASLHSPESYSWLKLKVTAIDLSTAYNNLAKILIPDIEMLNGNIFDIKDRIWDFTIASHIIEHVPDPVVFASRLQQVSRDFVLFSAPWNEDPIVTHGHVNTINKELISKLNAQDLNIYTNYSWGKNREVCTFWLPGKLVR